MILTRLKHATHADHLAIEARVDLLSQLGSVANYRRLLERFWGFYAPIEAQLVAGPDWASYGVDIQQRMKVPALARDLQALGLAPAAVAALPWKRYEIAAASELRNAIPSIGLRRSAQLAQLNNELARSNIELDAFASIASHDLKEPLRGLHNYANFLIEDYGNQIDTDGQAKLQTMIRLTERMDTLIDSLLHYARVGRVNLAMHRSDLNTSLLEILDRLAVSLEQQAVQVRIPRALPTIQCDHVPFDGRCRHNILLYD